MSTAYYGIAETAIGPLFVAGDGKRVVGIKFGIDELRAAGAAEQLHHELRGSVRLLPDGAKVRAIGKQLHDYLDGKRTAFDVEIDLSWVTPFRRDVLLACAAVPRGHVASYADLARQVGRPGAARAVGNTMHTNPIPFIIPCHRIVASDGSLGGFGMGLDVKTRLLALEGAWLA
jgi:methylated-DNA-[protein]-cysteine S-methyltransferase